MPRSRARSATFSPSHSRSRSWWTRAWTAGNYAEEKAGGLERTWTEVLSKALDKLIESIVLDEELVAALSKRLQSPARNLRELENTGRWWGLRSGARLIAENALAWRLSEMLLVEHHRPLGVVA